jgi:glycosyltransferase involved in cell wall biosynthesis
MRVALNLLYLIPGAVGGTEVYAVSLIEALAEIDDVNEYVIFLNRDGAGLLPNLPVRFRRVICPVRGTNRFARYLYEQALLPVHLYRDRVDVMHSLGYVAPLLCPCPSVVTIHDLNYHAFGSEMSPVRKNALALFVANSARSAQSIITVSTFSQKELQIHLGVPRDKTTVIYEASRFDASDRSPQVTEHLTAMYRIRRPYIIVFGGASANKNLPTLLSAYSSLSAELPHSLVLVGHLPRGVDTSMYQCGTAADRVVFTGYVPDEHVPGLLSGAELLVFPSWYEGFGLPIVEAQQLGVAVASSNAASLPEVAGNGALYFDPWSIDDMTDKIRRCLVDSDLRSRLIHRGYENSRRFSWNETARETIRVYERVCRAGERLYD